MGISKLPTHLTHLSFFIATEDDQSKAAMVRTKATLSERIPEMYAVPNI